MTNVDTFERNNRLGIIAYQLLMQAKGLEWYVTNFGSELRHEDVQELEDIGKTLLELEERIDGVEKRI